MRSDELPAENEKPKSGPPSVLARSHAPAWKCSKDTIPRLMALFARMPHDEMEKTIRTVTERAKNSKKSGSSYARLAEYLIGDTQNGMAVG